MLLQTATPASDGPPWLTIGLAALGAGATVIAGVLAYRSTRTASVMTAQAKSNGDALSSIDSRIKATLDGKDALIDDIREERNELRTQVGELRDQLAMLEATFSAFRDQTSAEIRDLKSEVNGLRSSDTAWRHWARLVLGQYATVVEKLRRVTGEESSPLPPSPPLN